MRIAMIGPFGLGPKGTMRYRALPIARALTRRGHAVKMLLPLTHQPQARARRWADGNVLIETVPAKNWLSPFTTTCRLVHKALAWRPQVVYCFKPKAYSGLAAYALWQLKRIGWSARLVVDEDDWEGPGGWNDRGGYSGLEKTFFAWQERWGLRHCDAVIVASRTLESLAWSLGLPQNTVYYVPNGIERPAPQGDGNRVRRVYGLDKAPIILLYTRLVEFDPERPLRVLQRISEREPAARMLVLGQALCEHKAHRFSHAAQRLGLEERILCLGWPGADRVPDFMAATDVALFPYDDDLINRTKCSVRLAQLLAHGVPIVADAVGENREYIQDGENGLLVTPGDEEAMAQATLRLLQQEALRQRLATAAKQRMEQRYHWDVLIERVLDAFSVPKNQHGG